MKNNRINKRELKFILLAILAIAFVGTTACEDTKKIDEANKFVDSANKKADEVKVLVGKAVDSFNNITKDMKDMEDFADWKKPHENELKELVKSYDKILALQKSGAGDFVEAAKLSSNEKFKTYYETSAKDVEKSAELINQSKELAQALLDTKDIESYNKKLDTIQAKSDSLTKESNELREKVKKLEEEVLALNK